MRLSKNHRFEEAMQWFHYIFNPMDDTRNEPAPERYWKVVPFKATPRQRLEEMFIALNAVKDDPDDELNRQVANWREHPFLPHAIARLRPIAYQKNVVMGYIDNLVAWGDQLFRQDTIEAINEATQLYVLAANMLGDRPQRIPRRKVEAETYAGLRPQLDAFSNALVILENEFPSCTGLPSTNDSGGGNSLAGVGTTLYFCIPPNDKLLEYWDTVADRLFKIRHCMNLEGIVRELPLFEPPIDPALLVQAVAQGVDLASVLNDLNAPTPYYHFSYMLQKALELCAEIRSLGGAVLSAVEKSDAEELAAIRASHETIILNLVKEVKKRQIDEATVARAGLDKTREVACTRYVYYQSRLTGRVSRVRLATRSTPNVHRTAVKRSRDRSTARARSCEHGRRRGMDRDGRTYRQCTAELQFQIPDQPDGYSYGGASSCSVTSRQPQLSILEHQSQL